MKRFIIILLTFTILLSCFLISCQKPIDTPQDESSLGNPDSSNDLPNNNQGDATDPEETLPTPDIPEDLNFGNNEVDIISRQYSIYNDEVTVDGTNGDPINDAVYKRQVAVEERLGVEIINHKMSPEGDFEANFDCINKVKSEK